MIRYGMVINLDRCIGCLACVVACKVENGTGPGVFWTYVEDEEIGTYPNVERKLVPRGCMHCEEPPCVEICPTHASLKQDNGIVSIDYDKCIGCQACIVSCPYGARSFVNDNQRGYYQIGITPYEENSFGKHQSGVVEKCTFCNDRLAQGGEPACVEVCPTRARIFGDLNNTESDVSGLIRENDCIQSLQELGYDPSIYYISSGKKHPDTLDAIESGKKNNAGS